MKNDSVTVELVNGFYIEIDNYNYALKERYTGTNKKGEEREGIRSCGYFSKITDAIERFLFLNNLSQDSDLTLEFREYVNSINASNKMVLKALESKLSTYPVK